MTDTFQVFEQNKSDANRAEHCRSAHAPHRDALEYEMESRSACDVSIIVPTYCEAENLSVLVQRIDGVLTEADLSGEIIIVDDNSPDETVEVCRALKSAVPVRLCVRKEERELSTAVIRGMNLAQGRVLVCMDADLSHPPEKLPELIRPLDDSDVEFVIGSRYVSGASTDEEWGFIRWLNSKVATWLARPLTKTNDPMAGFFALRRTTFHSATQLDPVGYKIGLELMIKCNCRNVEEIPIHFSDRLYGTSKLNLKEQIRYLVHLKRLYEHRFGNLAYASQFAAVGLSGMAIDLSVFAVLLMAWPITSARALAIWIAMTWNFFLNRYFTFSYAKTSGVKNLAIGKQYLRFCASCLTGAVVNLGVSVGLAHVSPFFARHLVWGAVAGIAAGFLLNYVMCRIWVFRDHR